jgi:hypothetical protein
VEGGGRWKEGGGGRRGEVEERNFLLYTNGTDFKESNRGNSYNKRKSSGCGKNFLSVGNSVGTKLF